MTADTAHAITVARYGLLDPLDWGEDCEDQLRRMTQFWNQLVEIEREHRAAYLGATAGNTAVAELEAAAEMARARYNAAKERRAKLRKQARAKLPTPELDAEIASALNDLRAREQEAKAARKTARETMRPTLAAIEERRKAAVKAARQNSGLYWGNYNAVLQSFDTARSRAIKDGSELHFRRHDGSGRLTTQIIGGMTPEELYEGLDSQLRIAPLPPTAWNKTAGRRAMRRGQRTTLTMVIYTRDRRPRHVTWPMIMHRPLPEGARIQSATVSRRRANLTLTHGQIVTRWEWSVSLLIRYPAPKATGHQNNACCGIDVGWRRLNDGLRVATVASDDGARRYIVLPEQMLSSWTHVHDLAAARDQRSNETVAKLQAMNWSEAPEELRKVAKEIIASPKIGTLALHRIARLWRASAPDWQVEELDALESAIRRNVRDWREMAGLQRRLSRHRRDLYLREAKQIAETFGVIGVEDVDWRKAQRRERPNGERNPAPLGWARVAAVGELLAAIDHQSRKTGAMVHRHSGVSTWICRECGSEIEPSDRSALYQTCPSCGATWDQDVNAARNLLAAAQASAAVAKDSSEPLAETDLPHDQEAKQPRWLRMQAARDRQRRQDGERSQST